MPLDRITRPQNFHGIFDEGEDDVVADGEGKMRGESKGNNQIVCKIFNFKLFCCRNQRRDDDGDSTSRVYTDSTYFGYVIHIICPQDPILTLKHSRYMSVSIYNKLYI